MRGSAFAAALLLAASVAPCAAPADGPLIEVETQTLRVGAPTVAAALAELQANAQVQAHALTRSVLGLRLELLPEPGEESLALGQDGRCRALRNRPAECRPSGCRLRDFEVRLKVEMLLPEWQPERAPAAGEHALWQGLHARLQAHEQRHREHAEAAARQLHQTLSTRLDRREPSDCLRLQTDLEALRHRTVQDLRMRDRIFDSSTAGALDVRRTLPRSALREQPAAR